MILLGKNISKVYKKKYTALKDVSLEVNKGDFIGIMGASGSGKTTLLNILGSIDTMTTGQLIIDSKDISTLNKKQLAKHRRKNIGFIFQDFNLLDAMTLKENIILPLALAGNNAHEIENEVQILAEDLKITRVLEKYPYEVSGGEQQRAACARALISKPKIILADEPTGNLDSKSTTNILKLFEFILSKYDATILMATHDAQVASYCNKVLFINDGEMFNQLYNEGDRKEFYNSIINLLQTLER